VGHILHERVPVATALPTAPALATLATVQVTPQGQDEVVGAAEVVRALAKAQPGFLEALVLRVRGAGAGVDSRYTGQNPPYISGEAMALIRAAGVQHLLLELPSVDREQDGGALRAHHTFWSVPQGRHDYQGVDPQEQAQARRRTITEMVLVPEALEDGPWWLQIQIPGFMLDAAPSRPILYPVSQEL
jgi:kynurenine formamidase